MDEPSTRTRDPDRVRLRRASKVRDHVERVIGRSFLRTAYRRGDEIVSPISHVIGFWGVLTVAAGLFATSVFLPMRQEQQRVHAAQDRAHERLDALRTELADLQATIRALEEDPVINEHAALRELNFHLPGQQIVSTRPETPDAATVTVTAGPTRRALRRGWLVYVPEDWLVLDAWVTWACQPDVRRGMLFAAAFLASTAFVLFAPPPPRPASLRVVQAPAPGPCQDQREPA